MRRYMTIIALMLLTVALIASGTFAHSPANEAFERTWARTEGPVSQIQVDRTWMWGPSANTPAMNEPYLDSPGGEREVQYFDKSRMEINDPAADPDELWFVTNGLLAWELISGEMQIGDAEFEYRGPAEVQIAGDPHPDSPTYALLQPLMEDPATTEGETITARLHSDGSVSDDSSMDVYDVTAAFYEELRDHTVASPFWNFMHEEGLVHEDGSDTTAPLFENPFFATGFPITEAYWATVPVDEEPTDVLVQCFERRCLTYTPNNPEGWQVEAGNIGQHYYEWRYDTDPDPGDADSILEPGGYVIADNGAGVSAPGGALSEPIGISIETASDPTDDTPIPDGYQQVGDYISIASSTDIELPTEHDGMVGLPVPESVNPDDLIVLALVPPELMLMHAENPHALTTPEWIPVIGGYDHETGMFAVTAGAFSSSGIIYSLAIHPHDELRSLIDSERHEAAGAPTASLQDNDERDFLVICASNFDDPADCTDQHREDTRDVLNHAADIWVDDIGFREPRLQLAGALNLCSFYGGDCQSDFNVYWLYNNDHDDCEDRTGTYTQFTKRAMTCITIDDSGSDNIRESTTRHELFHAIQRANFSTRAVSRSINNWMIEGTASATQVSPPNIQRANRHPMSVDIPIIDDENVWYMAQDFWVYLAEAYPLNLNDTLIELFNEGAPVKGGNDPMSPIGEDHLGPIAGAPPISDAYWEFVKNQAFEKQVELPGSTYDDVLVPGGNSCEFYPSSYGAEWDDDGDFEGYSNPDSMSISIDPEMNDPVTAQLPETIHRLSSQILQIQLQPTDYVYMTTIDAGNQEDLQYKIYTDEDIGTQSCWDPDKDNQSRNVFVREDPVDVWILFANTGIDFYSAPSQDAPTVTISEPTNAPIAADLEVELPTGQDSLIIDPLSQAEDIYEDPLDLHILQPQFTPSRSVRNDDDVLAGGAHRIVIDGREKIEFEASGEWFAEASFPYQIRNSQGLVSRATITIVQSSEIIAEDIRIELTNSDIQDMRNAGWDDWTYEIVLNDHFVDPVGDLMMWQVSQPDAGARTLSVEDDQRVVTYSASEDAHTVRFSFAQGFASMYRDDFSYYVENTEGAAASAEIVFARGAAAAPPLWEFKEVIEPIPDEVFVCDAQVMSGGGIAGTLINAGGQSQPFVVEHDGNDWTELPALGDQNTGRVLGVNNAGDVVGASFDHEITRPMLWNADGQPQDLLAQDDPGFTMEGEALAINDRGQAVGYVIDQHGDASAVVWVNGETIPLDDMATAPVGDQSTALLINNSTDPRTIVGANDIPSGPGVSVGLDPSFCGLGPDIDDLLSSNSTGFSMDFARGVIPLSEVVIDTLPTVRGGASIPLDIDDEGMIIGVSANADGQTRATVWEGSSATSLGTPGTEFTHSEARALGPQNSVVGTARGDGQETGFIWSSGDMVDLNNMNDPESGLTIVAASDVTTEGEILVWAEDGDGNVRPYLFEEDR